MSRSGRRRTGTSDARHRLLDMMGVQAPDEDLISVGISLQWAHVRPLRGRLVLGGLLALVVGLTTLALPELVGRTLDATVAGEVTWHLWATVTVIVVSVVTSLFDPPLLASVQAGGAMSLTRDLVRHCLRLGIPGRRPFEHGDLLNRAAGDVPAAVRYTTTRLELTVQAMIAVGSAIGLALVHWSFLLVLVAGVLVLTSLARRVLARFGDLIAEYRRNVGDLAGRYVDAERGRRTIAASGTLDREVVRVTRPLDELAESGRRLIAMQGRLGAQISALFDLSTVVLVALGGWLLTRSAITPGGIITALAYARFSMGSVIDLFDRGAFQLTASRVSAGRVAEVMRTPVATPPATDPAPPRLTPAASVRFEAVTVAGDEQPILDRLDLTVPAGATVALVGRSGAGKSTIAALVGRLLDPDRGTVRIDGVDVRSLDLDVLGGLVTYAFEQPTLLGET
ncbi:MAG TPA: ABC transporter ATP-binding protein, partial [Nitriliruptorales bacterium]